MPTSIELVNLTCTPSPAPLGSTVTLNWEHVAGADSPLVYNEQEVYVMYRDRIESHFVGISATTFQFTLSSNPSDIAVSKGITYVYVVVETVIRNSSGVVEGGDSQVSIELPIDMNSATEPLPTPPAPVISISGEYTQGKQVPVTWRQVSFSEPVVYVLQRSYDGGAFNTCYSGTSLFYYDTPPVQIEKVQYRVRAEVTSDRSRYSEWSTSAIKTAQNASPDTPSESGTVAGWMEQLQNNKAENIFPKTIIEAIFRQSDGKTLAELLEEIEDITGIPTGGASGQSLVKNSGTNYDIIWKTLFTYGTADLTAGSSFLSTGQIYLVYE